MGRSRSAPRHRALVALQQLLNRDDVMIAISEPADHPQPLLRLLRYMRGVALRHTAKVVARP